MHLSMSSPGGGGGEGGQPQGILTFFVATDQIPLPRATPNSQNSHPGIDPPQDSKVAKISFTTE